VQVSGTAEVYGVVVAEDGGGESRDG